MKKINKIFIVIIIVCLVIVSFVSHRIYALYTKAKRIKTGSYVASVGAYLQRGITKEPTIAEIFGSFGKAWRFLNIEEYDRLASILADSHLVDKEKVVHDNLKALSDEWGRQIVIAGRKISDNEPEFIIWSKGQDGILGTDDDISSPWGSELPKPLREQIEH